MAPVTLPVPGAIPGPSWPAAAPVCSQSPRFCREAGPASGASRRSAAQPVVCDTCACSSESCPSHPSWLPLQESPQERTPGIDEVVSPEDLVQHTGTEHARLDKLDQSRMVFRSSSLQCDSREVFCRDHADRHAGAGFDPRDGQSGVSPIEPAPRFNSPSRGIRWPRCLRLRLHGKAGGGSITIGSGGWGSAPRGHGEGTAADDGRMFPARWSSRAMSDAVP